MINLNNPKDFKGAVRFIYDGKVKTGTIFGSKFLASALLASTVHKYHVVSDNKVLDIPEHAIEEVKS